MRLLTFPLFLICAVTICAQQLETVGLRLGFTIADYKARETPGWNRSSSVTDISLHAGLNTSLRSVRYDRLSFSGGLVFSVRETTVDPMVRLNETTMPHAPEEDTVYIGRLYNRDQLLRIPLEVRWQLMEEASFVQGVFALPAIAVVVGLEPSVTLYRGELTNELYAAVDEANGLVLPYAPSKALSESIDQHYEPRFRGFTLAAYVGAELAYTINGGNFQGFLGGHYYLPVVTSYKCRFGKPSGMNAFIGFRYVL